MKLLFPGYAGGTAIGCLLVALVIFAGPVAAIELTVTGDLQNWALAPGTTNEDADSVHLNVTTGSTDWSVTVADALDAGKSSSTAGRMLEYNPDSSSWINGGSVLSQNMTVIGESVVPGILGSTAILGPTGKLIETGSAAADNKQMTITLKQPVATTDLRLTNGNLYRVVITFTGSEA